MNLRGRLASVINFRKRLGFEAKEHDEDTRVIVVELDTFPVGIIVDAVEEVIKIPDEKVQKLPETTTTSASKDYMTGVGMLDNRLVILLDVDKVLTSTELIELGEINQMMEKAEEAQEPAESVQVTDKAEEAPEAVETDQMADKTEESPETVETNQMEDKAQEAPEAVETDQMMEKAEEAPELAKSKKTEARQPAATANRRTRGRTG